MYTFLHKTHTLSRTVYTLAVKRPYCKTQSGSRLWSGVYSRRQIFTCNNNFHVDGMKLFPGKYIRYLAGVWSSERIQLYGHVNRTVNRVAVDVQGRRASGQGFASIRQSSGSFIFAKTRRPLGEASARCRRLGVSTGKGRQCWSSLIFFFLFFTFFFCFVVIYLGISFVCFFVVADDVFFL